MAFSTEPAWGTEWICASATERGAALADLLSLADALPQGLRMEGSPSLAEKVLAVDQALRDGGVPHAIGGALALAYYGEPRVTIAFDVNVFLPIDRWTEVRQALEPLPIDIGADMRELARHEDARLLWDQNPVHLLFSYAELHAVMPAMTRQVPFAGSAISIVSPEHLVVRKAMLDRPMDWLDIEAILVATEPLDVAEIEAWLRRLAGVNDPRVAQFRQLIRRSSGRVRRLLRRGDSRGR
jgi:hypothetical protein